MKPFNLKFEISEMAAYSTATPLVVDITERARPNFKIHIFISMENDSKGAFSLVPYGVLHIEDVRVYTHFLIKELGSSNLLNLYDNQFSDGSSMLKSKFQVLENKGFT